MAEITKEAVQEKLTKGETLTKEETQFVMSLPPDGTVETSDADLGFDDPAADNTDDEKKTPKGDKDTAADDAAKKQAEADEAARKKSEEEEAAKKQKETDAAKAKKADEESFHEKVENTLSMPDNQINLDGYTDREKGLFWTLRKERKARQQAEADRDAERFERIKKQKEAEEKAKVETPAADDDEFPTKGELRKLEKAKEEKRVAEEAARARAVIIRTSDIAAQSIVESRKAKGEDLPDYEKVMELGPMIIEGNDEYAGKIKDAWQKGKNAALLCYDLIRNDPRFKSLYNPSAPAAEKKEEKKDPPVAAREQGKDNLRKIDENTQKAKTSGVQGGGGGGGDYGEYSFDQLFKMTPGEFRKVPKNIREKFLYDAG